MTNKERKTPIVMDMEPGKKAWCSCGLTKNEPFCDGSHKGSGMSPTIVVIEETKKIAWCTCKQSANGAFCDGSHSKA
jgi:CDGSH iron-sulfur domain-containing protein 3